MKRTLVIALLVALGATSLAAAAIARGEGAGSFAATFEGRAVGDTTMKSCPGIGPGGQKIEARYEGPFTTAGDPPTERPPSLRLSLEILFDRAAGVGIAKGNWQLVDPPDPDIVGRGQLLAVVSMVDPPDPDVDPPDPDLELHGLLTGAVDPPDPDMPAQLLLGNFSASLGEGATFPHLKGEVGDPTGLTSNPAVLVPAVKC